MIKHAAHRQQLHERLHAQLVAGHRPRGLPLCGLCPDGSGRAEQQRHNGNQPKQVDAIHRLQGAQGRRGGAVGGQPSPAWTALGCCPACQRAWRLQAPGGGAPHPGARARAALAHKARRARLPAMRDHARPAPVAPRRAHLEVLQALFAVDVAQDHAQITNHGIVEARPGEGHLLECRQRAAAHNGQQGRPDVPAARQAGCWASMLLAWRWVGRGVAAW